MGDYRNIVGAIGREARVVAAAARSQTAIQSPELPASGGALSAEEACAVLGVDAVAGLEEIGRTFSGLLQVGDDAEAQARRQEITAAAAVLQRKARPGPR